MKIKSGIAAFSAALVLFFGLSAGGFAAVPGLLSYQGTLRKSGVLYNGTVTMQFLITSADGSSVYWTSGSTDVAVTGGLFRYALGSSNQVQFAAIPWKDITPYVQMAVDGGWMPKEPLYASAYAMHAYTAEASSGTFTAVDGDIRISTSSGSKGLVFQDGTAQYSAAGWAVSGQNVVTAVSGNAGVGVAAPQARLDVQAVSPSGYTQIWRNSSGVVKASMTASGLFYSTKLEINDGDGNITTSGIKFDNFSCTSAQKLTADSSGNLICAIDQTGGGGSGGNVIDNLFDTLSAGNDAQKQLISNLGSLSIGLGTAGTSLDVQGDGFGNAQFWRDNSGVIQASMTATGALYATAVTAEQVTSSSVTVPGALGMSASKIRLTPGIEISSASPSQQGGVSISSHVYLAPGAKYYGDGSGLTAINAANVSAGKLADAQLSANVPLLNGSQVFSGVNTFASSFTVTSATGAAISRVQFASGVSISSSPAYQQGGLYISSHVYLAPGAKYYGDGSGITAVNASNVSAGTLADAQLSANVPLLNGSQVFSGVNTFASSFTVTSATGAAISRVQFAPGVAISSSSPAFNGGVYISSNVYIVGIASATQYFGDGSKLTGIISGGGNNLAATLAAGSDAGNGYIVNLSSLAVGRATAGAQLDVQASAPLTYSQIWRNSGGVAVASVTAAGVIYGDGSGLKNLLTAETDPVFGAAPAHAITGTEITNWDTAFGWGNHQTAGYSKLASDQTFAGINTFSSSATFSAQDPSFPGVYISSGLVVNLGNVGIGSPSPQAKLDVNGGIKLSNTADSILGTIRYTGTAFEGYNNNTWQTLNGSYSLATSTALWGVTTDTVYTVGLSSKVAIGIATAGVSKLRVVGADTSSVANAFIAQDSGFNTIFTVRNDGNVGIGPVNPATRLDVQAAGSGGGYAQIWRNSGGSVVSNMTDAGGLSANGQITAYSSMTVAGAQGIGAYQLNLNPGVSVSSSAAKGGVYVSSNVYIVGIASATRYYGDGSQLTGIVGGGGGGNTIDTLAATLVAGSDAGNGYIVNLASMAVGRATAGAPLDAQAGAGDSYVQFWRNSAGIAVATVTTGGVFYGDGSGLKNLLAVETDPVFAAAPAHAVTDPEITNWNTAYGWGSHQTAGYSKLAATQTFTGSNTFTSTSAFTAISNSLPGVYVSSGLVVNSGNLVVNSGNVGIGNSAPRARLDVNGGIKIGDTSDTAAGTLKFTGAVFIGCNGSICSELTGSIVTDSTALWGVGPTTVYTMGASSNVAIGTSNSVSSKLLVLGADNTSATNAFLAESNDTTQLFRVRNDGNVGIGPVDPATRLDVQAVGSDGGYAQIWRNSGGSVVSNMTDTGGLTANGQITSYSSMTVAGVLGIGVPQVMLTPGVWISSSVPVYNGGVYVSSNVYIVGIASATQYYGDGSQLTGVHGSDNLGNHKATQDLNLNTFNLINVASITANAAITTYSSMTVAGELGVNRISLNPLVGISSSPTGLYISSSVYIAASARYYGDGSGLNGWIGTPMTRNLATGGNWLSGDGDNEGLSIDNSGKVGVGIAPTVSLDVKGVLGDGYVQIWRDSGGAIVSSMSATGVLYASGLGLAPAVTISSSNPVYHGGVYVSSNIFIAGISSATAYYGDGSHLTGITGGSGGWVDTATSDLNMNGNSVNNASNIGATMIGASTLGVGTIATAIPTQPYITVSTHVYIAGHSAVGNGITALSTFSAVTILEHYTGDVTGPYGNNIGLDVVSELAPLANDMYNFTTGGRFIASMPDGDSHNSAMLRGIHSLARARNSGNLMYAAGVIGGVNKTNTGTVDKAFGGYFSVSQDQPMINSVITNAYGVYGMNYSYTGNTMTNSYAIYADSAPAGTTGITNNYGVYINDQSGVTATKSYNLYSKGATSKNHFEGAASVGTTLSVGTTATAAPVDIQASGGDLAIRIESQNGAGHGCIIKLENAATCTEGTAAQLATHNSYSLCLSCN